MTSDTATFDALAKLQVQLGDLTKAIEQDVLARRKRQMVSDPIPWLASGAITGASGTAELGGPQKGRKWIVRRLAVVGVGTSGSAPVVAAAEATATCDYFVASSPTTALPGSFAWRLTGIPQAVGISTDQIPLLAKDRLIATITGGTNSRGYIAMALVSDVDEAVDTVGIYQF